MYAEAFSDDASARLDNYVRRQAEQEKYNPD